MSGPRILAVVAGAILVMIVMALRHDSSGTVQRGVEISEAAFAAVETLLEELEPDYAYLQEQGLVLAMREEHDGLRTRLAELRSQQVGLVASQESSSLERLEALKDIAHQADLLSARAHGMQDKLAARAQFVRDCNPLVMQARAQRDRLARRADPDAQTESRVADLGRNFAELENQVRSSMLLLQQNVAQGKIMAAVTLSGLRTLIDQQAMLLADLEHADG